jgi:uncharacterized protein (DUF488 family)
MEMIFRDHMTGDRSQAELAQAMALVRTDRVCLLCFEHDPAHCHRRIVADMIAGDTDLRITHLFAMP